MALSKDDILNAIAEMSVMDVVELVSAMEEKFGVSAAAAVAAAAPAAAAAEAVEEKTEFDIVLKATGEKKVNDLVDGAPSTLKEGVAKAEAEAAKKELEEAGATVELK